jgi:hypothetical protein
MLLNTDLLYVKFIRHNLKNSNNSRFVIFYTNYYVLYADDVNLLGDNIDTIKKNTETFIYASKLVGLEVNTETTNYMLLSRHQNAG